MTAHPAAAGLSARSLLLLVLCAWASTHALPAAAAGSTQSQQQQQQQRVPFYRPQLLHYGSSVAPVLTNYSFSTALDTFDICRQQSGMPEGQEVSQEELLQQFRLPKDLNKHKALTLPQLLELLHSVQPEFRVVFEPMLSGESDIGRLIDPSQQPHSLPKLVHFTVKDKNQLKPHQVLAMASWAYYNPGYSLMLFDDADIRAFMTTYYPQLLPTFDGLGSPVERTDMWRYLVLCRLGGVYADSDVMAARPISQWAQDAGLLVGIENAFTTPEEARERSYSRQVQMVQWTIASRPGHPVVCRMGQYVAAHVAEERAGEFLDPDRDHAILERTGPGIWSDSVHDYLRQVANISVEQLIGGGRVGDVRILPQPVFGCPTAVFDVADPLPYAYHMFMGSWKLAQPSGLVVFMRRLSSTLHRQHQLKDGTATQDSSSTAAATATATAATASQAMHPHKPPRRPILEEQIERHLAQQHQQQGQQQRPRTASSLQGAQAASVAAGPQALQPHQLPAQQQQQALAAAAAVPVQAQRRHSSRKLRSSQVLLVRAPGMPGAVSSLGVTEPELPLSTLSGLPTLSLLLVAVLLVTLCKRQLNGHGGVWSAARDGLKAVRGAVGLPPARSPLSRPHSRTHLGALVSSGGGGLLNSPVLVAPLPPGAAAAALAAASAASGGSRGGLPPVQEAVGFSSSQQAARGHGHKRSWGSSSSFQQL